MELPYVIKAYEKYHGKGFEIIGVSLDSDKNALQNLIKVKDMKWPQYQAAEGFRNKLVQKYGVDGIPAIYLIDGTGKIIGKGAHGEGMTGEDLDAAIGKALAKK